ncbi:MAG: hypothetical protein KGQ37_00195 [Hyphomicrobiales bacterium]|nr:hypothetical protein [Hyphomicrobiales bacterium]
MSDVMHQASDADLHRYVDGESGHRERDAVRQWLAAHDEDAERVAAWRLQRQLLHARFDGVVRESLPAALSLRASSTTRFAISPQSPLTHPAAEPPLAVRCGSEQALGHSQVSAFVLGFCAALVLVCLLVFLHRG